MAFHLLVLERLARVLPVAGRAQRAMARRHAVRRFQPGEVPPLHAPGEALALRRAADINHLPNAEMRRRQSGSRLQQRIRGNAEFHQLLLRLDLRLGEVPALRLGDVLHLRRP